MARPGSNPAYVPGLNFKTCCFLSYIVVYILLSFVAVTILTDVCVICCYFICLVSLSQQYVTCQNFTLSKVVANESSNAYRLFYAMNK